jgi:hypothetical protein
MPQVRQKGTAPGLLLIQLQHVLGWFVRSYHQPRLRHLPLRAVRPNNNPSKSQIKKIKWYVPKEMPKKSTYMMQSNNFIIYIESYHEPAKDAATRIIELYAVPINTGN